MKKIICIILSIVLMLSATVLPTFAERGIINGEIYYDYDGFDYVRFYTVDGVEVVYAEKYYMDRWEDIDGVHRRHPHDSFMFSFSEDRKSACITKYEGGGERIVLPDSIDGVPVTSIGVDCFKDYGGYITEIRLGKYFSDFNYLSIPRFPELAKITVSPENEKYYDIDGILMERNECSGTDYGRFFGDTMLFCPHNAEGTFYVPDEAGIIATGAFMDIKATKIVLSEYTFKVCKKAFQNCSYTALVVRNPYTKSNSPYCSDCDCDYISYDYVTEIVKECGYPLYTGKTTTTGSLANSLKNIDGMKFFTTFNDDGERIMKLWKYTGSASELTIPDNIGGIPVTEIMTLAFASNKYLTKVTVPDSVKIIMPLVFSGDEKLTDVVIGDGVESIGFQAFADCPKLMNVSLGKSISTIGQDIFINCKNLESITLSTENESYALCNGMLCDAALTTVYVCPAMHVGRIILPNSIREIKPRAFRSCYLLAGVTLPSGLLKIGAQAFEGCSRFTSLAIPDTVTEIGYSAFAGCSSVANISVPDGVTEILPSAFEGCKSVIYVSIPGSVTYIGENAFKDCTSVTDIYYGGSVFAFKSELKLEETGNEALSGTWHFEGLHKDLGDLNADKKINVSDNVQLKKIVLGMQSPTEYEKTAGDINVDTKINAIDANLMAEMIVGKIG